MAKQPDISARITDLVKINALKPNPWNTNVVTPDNEQKIDESLRRFGWIKPIIVRTLDDGTLEILGGQHRWEAGKRLGHTEVPVFNLGTIDDKTAKEVGLVDNGRYGEDDPVALSRLLHELGAPSDLALFLPYTSDDLNSIFTASSIDIESLGLDDDTKAPELPGTKPAPTHQVMRFKVPVEDVAWITNLIESTMKAHNFTADDSLTNAGNALVELLKPNR